MGYLATSEFIEILNIGWEEKGAGIHCVRMLIFSVLRFAEYLERNFHIQPCVRACTPYKALTTLVEKSR